MDSIYMFLAVIVLSTFHNKLMHSSVSFVVMDSFYIFFTVILFATFHNKLMYSSGCQLMIRPIGNNVTFEYVKYYYIWYFNRWIGLNFTHGDTYVIQNIDSVNGSSGRYSITSDYQNRVSVYGYIVSTFRPPWNISVTLTNITRGDKGMYQLRSEQSVVVTFCLSILDTPQILNQKSEFGHGYLQNGTITIFDGIGFSILGQPAEIVPINSSYDATMTWMLNGDTIQTGGLFVVHQEELIVLSVTPSFHGAVVTYRASVDGTDVWTEVETRLIVVYMEVRLMPSQTFYDVSSGSRLPAIACNVTSSYKSGVMWTRGVEVIANGSVLSLGLADVAMSGEYRCEVKLFTTGQVKEKYVYINVFEKSERPTVATIILSTISGLTVASVVVMAILLWRSGNWKRREPADTGNTSPDTEMSSYTNLEFRPDNQQLYDSPGPSGVDVSKT